MAEEFKQLHKAAHLTLIEEKIQPVAEDENTNRPENKGLGVDKAVKVQYARGRPLSPLLTDTRLL